MPIHNVTTVRKSGSPRLYGDVTLSQGSGVTLTQSGNDISIAASGGPGAGWTLVEVNLGSTASWRGKFTLTDAGISPSSKVMIHQAPGPYTGKGTRADEAEMDPLWCVAEPGSGQATVYWRTLTMLSATYAEVRGTQPVTAANTQHGGPFLAALAQQVVGRVRGNVKFLYTVA